MLAVAAARGAIAGELDCGGLVEHAMSALEIDKARPKANRLWAMDIVADTWGQAAKPQGENGDELGFSGLSVCSVSGQEGFRRLCGVKHGITSSH